MNPTKADINAAVEALLRNSAPRSHGRFIAFVGQEQARQLTWAMNRVWPRESCGEYVPIDERHPPVTADILRKRLQKAPK